MDILQGVYEIPVRVIRLILKVRRRTCMGFTHCLFPQEGWTWPESVLQEETNLLSFYANTYTVRPLPCFVDRDMGSWPTEKLANRGWGWLVLIMCPWTSSPCIVKLFIIVVFWFPASSGRINSKTRIDMNILTFAIPSAHVWDYTMKEVTANTTAVTPYRIGNNSSKIGKNEQWIKRRKQNS